MMCLLGLASLSVSVSAQTTADADDGPQEYLVFTTYAGDSCSGTRETYMRYTLNQCMLTTSNVDGYVVQSSRFAAYNHGNYILLRMHMYTDASCLYYLDTVTYHAFNTTCGTGIAPSAAPTILLHPTAEPTTAPTVKPSASPSTPPTPAPSSVPSLAPTNVHVGPTVRPTLFPTTKPTTIHKPSAPPTAAPTVTPTRSPSYTLMGAKVSFSEWDDVVHTPSNLGARLKGAYSYSAEITTDGSLPTETGFFTRFTLSTQHCGQDENVYMYHWSYDQAGTTAKCKSKAGVLFLTHQNNTYQSTSIKVTVSAGTTGEENYALGSSDVRHCFAGTELVQMADGSSRMMSDLQIGDEILTADRSGKQSFSPVVAIPHPKSSVAATFVQLSTASGKDIKMTSEHLIACEASCVASASPSLMKADAVRAGMCLYSSVEGGSASASGAYAMDKVTAVEMVSGRGAFTVVPGDEMIVVNGLLASPFAFNHAANHAYYNVWRALYSVLPSSLTSMWVRSANEVFGLLAMKVWSN